MMKKKCYIVGAGEFAQERFQPDREDYIIAADGGYAYLKQIGIVPDMVVGDFDSLGYIPQQDHVVCHPVMKDDTDLALAAKSALQKGYNNLHIFGASGGRLDHTIAAMQLLVKLAKTGVQTYLYGCGFTMTALFGGGKDMGEERCQRICFPKEYEGGISVFAFTTQAEGVCEEGLLYSLHDAVLRSDEALGVSNSFVGTEAQISVNKGALIIMWYGNEGLPLPFIDTLKK